MEISKEKRSEITSKIIAKVESDSNFKSIYFTCANAIIEQTGAKKEIAMALTLSEFCILELEGYLKI